MKLTELFTDEEQWTKGAFARNNGGGHVWLSDPSACRWCLLGRLRFVTNQMESLEAEFVKKATGELHPGFGLVSFNDAATTQFADVQAVLARAEELRGKA